MYIESSKVNVWGIHAMYLPWYEHTAGSAIANYEVQHHRVTGKNMVSDLWQSYKFRSVYAHYIYIYNGIMTSLMRKHNSMRVGDEKNK